jgi:hypothetical protein
MLSDGRVFIDSLHAEGGKGRQAPSVYVFFRRYADVESRRQVDG